MPKSKISRFDEMMNSSEPLSHCHAFTFTRGMNEQMRDTAAYLFVIKLCDEGKSASEISDYLKHDDEEDS